VIIALVGDNRVSGKQKDQWLIIQEINRQWVIIQVKRGHWVIIQSVGNNRVSGL